MFGKSLVHRATSDAKTTNNIKLIKGNVRFEVVTENVINCNFRKAIFNNPLNYIFKYITTLTVTICHLVFRNKKQRLGCTAFENKNTATPDIVPVIHCNL